MESDFAQPRPRVLLAILPALFIPFLSALVYFVILKDGSAAQGVYIFTKIFTLVWPIYASRHLVNKISMPFVFKPSRQAIFAGVRSGMYISLIFLVLLTTPLKYVVFAAAPAIRNKAQLLGVFDYYLYFSFFLAVLHSFIEEYYWRWFVFGLLSRSVRSQILAHVVAAIGFALHHVVISSQFFPQTYGLIFRCFIGFGGFIWSKLYQRENNLFASWVSHLIVDVVILSAGFF